MLCRVALSSFDMIQEFAVAAEAVRNTHWDVCVIGAGPVGLCLALNLAKAGRKVVVLEAGGQGYEASVQQLYGGSTDGDIRFAGLTEGRFRGLGGTSTQWGGQILEMDSHIFERREWIEGSGWPISKSTLAPYYQRALEFEGLGALTRDQHE
jgi:choline dehydrogenase-like flavoprotein